MSSIIVMEYIGDICTLTLRFYVGMFIWLHQYKWLLLDEELEFIRHIKISKVPNSVCLLHFHY